MSTPSLPVTPAFDLSRLPPLSALEAERDRRRGNRLYSMFPADGPYRRELYRKHMEFIEATKDYNELLFVAANKVGKTVLGAYIMAVWLTGLYPKWWNGRRFKGPITAWAVNKTNNDCRDINQGELLGAPGQMGTGMIPRSHLITTKTKPSVPDGVEIAYIKHVSGLQSTLLFKSYDAGREAFQGRNIDAIWADEEIPDDVYSECLLRLMTTDGIMLCTYTPIMGLTRVTVNFLANCANKAELPPELQISEPSEGEEANVGV